MNHPANSKSKNKMGGLIETDKMRLHRENCLVCQAADGDIQNTATPGARCTRTSSTGRAAKAPGTHAACDQDQENADRG